MKHFSILFFVYFFSQSLPVFSQFDVRGVNWGASIDDVIKSEYPLIPERNKNELKYDEVDIGNSTISSIIYSFTNGKLIEVRYIVYGNSKYYNGIGTCEYQVSMENKYLYTKFIFDALFLKEYKCLSGWRFLSGNTRDERFFDKNNALLDKNLKCDLSSEVLAKIDKIGQEIESSKVEFTLENKRSYLNVVFNNPLNNKKFRNCNSLILTPNFFNTYLWLIYEPNLEVKRELTRSNF